MQPAHAHGLAQRARERAVRDYSWLRSLRQLDELLDAARVPAPQTAVAL